MHLTCTNMPVEKLDHALAEVSDGGVTRAAPQWRLGVKILSELLAVVCRGSTVNSASLSL